MNIIKAQFKAMGGTGEIVIACNHESSKAEQIVAQAKTEITRIEKKYSRYDSQSVVSKINQSAGLHSVDIEEETLSLINYAKSLYEQSQTLFDPTSGVLRQIWSFDSPRIPSLEELQSKLKLIGWPKVRITENQVFLQDRGMEIDFGGFGKEYALDRAASILKANGIESGYINLSGDIFVLGPKPDLKAWRMGIQHPRKVNQIMANISIMHGALATSGDYERFFELDGQRFCHILNPKTGMPVQHWQSVSVLAPLASVAGACSTIAMLLQENGLDYLNSTGYSYFAVDKHGKIHSKAETSIVT
jgi:thiamine biosynthesis lipoprotein